MIGDLNFAAVFKAVPVKYVICLTPLIKVYQVLLPLTVVLVIRPETWSSIMKKRILVLTCCPLLFLIVCSFACVFLVFFVFCFFYNFEPVKFAFILK